MRTCLLSLMLLLLSAPAAWAQDEDLPQTIADLSSQTADKERLDTLGTARIEINQIRVWLTEATNAIKEDEEEMCRLILQRVRAQLRLVDELILQSQLKADLQRLEKALVTAKRVFQDAKRSLEDKLAKIRAMKAIKQGR